MTSTDTFGPQPGDAVYDDMVDWRRQLHRRPELSFAEHDTTTLIRDHMASLGIEEALRTTETGGIFAMEGGRPGRDVVLVQAAGACECRVSGAGPLLRVRLRAGQALYLPRGCSYVLADVHRACTLVQLLLDG